MVRALNLLYRVGAEQVDYRDLSVRHLGTIFEQLLAFELTEGDDGHLRLEAAGGRKRTGAYFTPEHIVDDIVERTLAPLFDERSVRAAAVGKEQALDALLDLQVLDPAMGSGHFLVGAAAYLARRIANDPSYDGDLTLVELQGLVAERCLYGVDVNAMAVEVARLALWLSTVRDDRPLRFLGNLRAGNSLVSAELRALLEGGADLFAAELAARAQRMFDQVSALARVHALTGQEAHEKQRIAGELDALREPLLAECDRAVHPPVGLEAGRPFHWELEFPDRFLDEQGNLLPDAGFDAVIGNPPYVRIQELGRDVAAYCRERYATAYGSFDAYVPFLERALWLLRKSGRLGFIVPTTFLKLDYGQRLRAVLARESLVETIVDFGHAQVFEGATNYTCVLVLNRGGASELTFTAVKGSVAEVRRAVASGELPEPERYAAAELGPGPWLLVPHEERTIVDAMKAAGPRLSEVTKAVFTGLQTSADHIYILEDRGMRGGHRVLVDHEGSEVELEPDLIHPLASGSDVERYAIKALRSALLFPYRRHDGEMKLVTEAELETLPRTWGYLKQHETELRARERGKMNRDDSWWAFGRTQSLGLHDRPKLGVAATVRHLEVAAEPSGLVCFHNVRVNGILPRQDSISLFSLLAVLNSRPVDFAFRRGAAPLQNEFFTANKQFISWLPVPDPVPVELETRGRRLHELSATVEKERAAFLDWLGTICGVDVRGLAGRTKLEGYALAGRDAVLGVLDANASRLRIDPRVRAHRERISSEVDKSATKIAQARAELKALEREVDLLLCDAYGLAAWQRAAVDSDYTT